MKKILSLVLAMVFVMALFTGFSGSATENLIPIDEEAMQDFPLTAYFPDIDPTT